MPSDHNPWNTGGAGKPPNVTRLPESGPSWNGGGRGPTPPNLEDVLARLRALVASFLSGGARALALAAVAVIAIWLLTGFYRVQPDEQALVLRFGAYVRNAPPGLNYHAPWPIESALLLPVTRINRVEIGFVSTQADDEAQTTPTTPEGRSEPGRDTPDRDLREESLMLTGDENIVDINASVFWRISNAADFAFKTRHPSETVKDAAESMLRQVVGHTKIQSALTEGRAAIEQAVTAGTQKILDAYGSGVEITQVQLQKVDPPEEVVESFRDVQRATTDADRARNEAQSYSNDIVPRARGDAAAIIFQAQGDKQAAISRSTGESQRFLSVYAAYALAKDVTLKRLYIETMQELLKNSETTVIDDRLRSLLPTLSLNRTAQPEAPR